MRCKRISTVSASACCFACGVGRTLNPMIIALLAAANVTSLSLMAPTAEWTILTRTPSTSIFFKEAANASAEPCTSALIITLTSFNSPSFRLSNKLSNVTRLLEARCSINARFARSSPAARAVFSSSKTTKRSPACGTSFKPVISTGVAGPAALSRRPKSFVITRTRP